MTKKDPRLMTDEEKLEGLAAAGRLGEVPEKKEDPLPPEPPTPKEDPVVPPTVEVPPKTETPPVVVEEPKKPLAEGETTPPPSTITTEQGPKRPVRYIPIDKYQDDKKAWEKTDAELATANARIAELESLSEKVTGAPKTEEAIKNFSEKYAMEENDVRDLLSAVRSGSELPEGTLETLQSLQLEKAAQKEAEYFNTEWSPLEASLKVRFPNASPEQLKQAREKVNELAHTEKFIDKDLDYVLYKNNADVETLLGEATPPVVETDPTKVPRRTAESSRPAGTRSTLSAADFKDRTDFTDFNTMDPGEVKAIIKDMDPKTYRAYVAFASSQEGQGGVTVMRNGQKVVLK